MDVGGAYIITCKLRRNLTHFGNATGDIAIICRVLDIIPFYGSLQEQTYTVVFVLQYDATKHGNEIISLRIDSIVFIMIGYWNLFPLSSLSHPDRVMTQVAFMILSCKN